MNHQVTKYNFTKTQYTSNDNHYSQILTARVIDIILNNSHPEFDRLGGWNSLGTIFFGESNKIININTDLKSLPYARPLYSNKKNYPLKNEIVYIISFPFPESQNNISLNEYYYIDSINIWNHPHHNALPQNDNVDEKLNNDYQNSGIGNVQIQKENSQNNLNLGETFKEKSNVKPLLPYEGDYIIEGRFGNSIRLGSTVKDKKIPNPWSENGVEGDPIIIIRNGQYVKDNKGWVPTLEEINKDDSSIYFTKGQSIPIKVASDNLKTFNINLQQADSPSISIPNNTPVPQKEESSNVVTSSFNSNNVISKNAFTSSFSSSLNEEDNFNVDPSLFEDNEFENLDSIGISDNYNNVTTPSSYDSREFSGVSKVYYNVPYQSQNDSNDFNIRKYGCAATSCAMLISYVKKTNYSKEDIIRINKGIAINFASLALKTGLRYREVHNYSDVANVLQEGPVILLVDSLSEPKNPTKQHFVVVVGIDSGGGFIIHDPVRRFGPNIILSKLRYHYFSPKNKIRIFY